MARSSNRQRRLAAATSALLLTIVAVLLCPPPGVAAASSGGPFEPFSQWLTSCQDGLTSSAGAGGGQAAPSSSPCYASLGLALEQVSSLVYGKQVRGGSEGLRSRRQLAHHAMHLLICVVGGTARAYTGVYSSRTQATRALP